MIKSILIWSWLISSGYAVDMNEKHVGRKLYTFYMPQGKTVRYAYKKEIIRFIKKKNWEFIRRGEQKKNK